MSGYESVLFVARECFVYRVPPRTSTAGYKAMEWGDMEAFLWKGRLRVMERNADNASSCSIRLEDKDTGDLFAECPYDVSGTSVEPVLDSSRYFVLRVESSAPDGSIKKAYIGMGFQDRSDSFDFNVALQDWTKRQKAATSESSAEAVDDGPSPHLPSGPKKDFTLREGETISIKLPGGGARKPAKPTPNPFGGTASFLPPPPSKKR